MNNQKEQKMHKAESVFWGMVVVAGLYLLFGGDAPSQKIADAQLAQAEPAAVQAAPAAGCGMNNGGSCGCGGGTINNPPGI